ncbi:MAG: PAS domain-containing protein, partial [Phycisphaerales bacterium JB064]
YQDVRFRMRHRDGTWRWIRASGKAVAWNAKGKPTRMVGTHTDVTDTITGEVRLNEANQRMELALQAGQMGVWDWNLETGEFNCDHRWADILGETVDNLLPDASTAMSRVHQEDQEDLELAIQRHLDGEESHINAQCRMRHRNGSWRWVRIFGKLTTQSPTQEGSRLVGIQVDVHDQVVAQERLTRRESLLANTIRMAGIGGWELDLITMQLLWSDQVRAIHEVPEDYEPKVETAIDFYEDEYREQIAESVRRAMEFGQPYDIECRFVTAKGNRRWVRSVGEPVYSDGEIVRLVGAFQDITDQQSQRDALQSANEELEAAQSIARMGSWTFDPQTQAVEWSRQMYELFDRNPADGPLTYDEVMAEFAPHNAERLHKAVVAAAEHGTAYSITLPRLKPKGAARILLLEGRAKTDEDGKVVGLYGTTRDVTSEVEREAALREAQLRAEDANRSKTEFLANMSHEIRTPMTAILGFADLLEDPQLDGSQKAEHVATIKRNGEHLLTIINDILDISKIEAGRMVVEKLDASPHDILRGVSRLMRVKADAKGLGLELHCKTPVPNRIHTDPTRLRQILVNLIGNAIKFSERGRVVVSLSFTPNGQGGLVNYEVSDTGIGMTPEQIDNCFTAFTQADATMARRFGGTGLGLRISKRLAEMLGGDISVTSTPGRGSSFTVSVDAGDVRQAEVVEPGPIAMDVVEIPSAEQPVEPAALQGLRILLMEDGIDNLRLITMHLKRSGANVTTARDGAQGIAHLTTNGKLEGPLLSEIPFDIILTDMQMPELDGYSAVRWLRAKGCTLPIVALTAHAMSGDKQRCFDAGCDAYATKPITRTTLVNVILEAMEVKKQPD